MLCEVLKKYTTVFVFPRLPLNVQTPWKKTNQVIAHHDCWYSVIYWPYWYSHNHKDLKYRFINHICSLWSCLINCKLIPGLSASDCIASTYSLSCTLAWIVASTVSIISADATLQMYMFVTVCILLYIIPLLNMLKGENCNKKHQFLTDFKLFDDLWLWLHF